MQQEVGPGETIYSFDNYVRAYLNPRTYSTLLTSLFFTASVCGLTLALAYPIAWIVERTNTPLRGLFYLIGLVPLIIPEVLTSIAWIFLLHPSIGLINVLVQDAFGLANPPFPVYSFGGMVWVQALSTTPLAFLLLSAALKSTDPALEEAAMMSGANNLQIMRRISLRLMRPAVAGVVLIVAVQAISAFEIPALVGLPDRIFVLSTQVYGAYNRYPPDFGYGTALAVGLLGVAAIGVWLYGRATRRTGQFQTVTGKAFRPRIVDLGRFRYLTLAVLLIWATLLLILPGMIILWSSLLPYFQVPRLELLNQLSLDNYAYAFNHAATRRAMVNSFILGVSSATIVVLVAATIAWIVIKTRLPGKRLLDYLAFLPIGVPGVVLGVAMIQMFINFPLPVYGTMFVLVFAYVCSFLPYGMRAASPSLIQVHTELEEAAKMAGSSWWNTFRRILLPLILPGLVAGWIYVFVVSFSKMSTAIMLTSKDNLVVAVTMFYMFQQGEGTTVAALGIMMVTALLAIVVLVVRVGGRFGVRP